MLMPILVAYLTISKWPREARWLATILKRAADTSGFELARNLLDDVPIRIRNVIEG
jgi:hypothetical protein